MTGGVAITGILTELTASAVEILIASTTVMTTNDKCTWVASAYIAAPTFTLADGAGNLGLNTVNW